MSRGDGMMRGERSLEILAVILLGVATLGSGWCGYQATKWNGEETTLARAASDQRVEAARLFGLATQRVSYDSMVIGQYAQAVRTGDDALLRFYRETLIRPEFEPVLERWKAQVDAGADAPSNLLGDQEYLDEQFADYQAAEALAVEDEQASSVAAENADEYVLLTLLLALSLFFAGVTTSFRVRAARVLLLGGSALTVVYAAGRLIELPVL